ncbi:unnamed protein product [Candida verbasci]|uniref:5'-3' DNA helicase ZGRF1-like N-terminal domain-containing protein n=1 Tax=Candida verbasci TaxID=1227364 RepID=A0A9W4XLB6_9ASCO|nr:unnamed protein product [Candida verbasci]
MNVSIIHEYNILYSDRIYQKDKKWSDGILKFYEFNNKLEIYSSSKVLVAIDFLRDKPIVTILNKWLEINNEFKLPNNQLIIQIQEHVGVYEKDLTNVFKKGDGKVDVKPRVAIKRKLFKEEPIPAFKMQTLNKSSEHVSNGIYQPEKILRGPSRPSKSSSQKLQGSLSSKSRLKTLTADIDNKNNKNSRISEPSVINNNNINSKKLSSTDLKKKKPVQKSSVSSNTSNNNNKFMVNDLRVQNRKPIRIKPKSSTYFQHLYIDKEQDTFTPLCVKTNSFQITPEPSQVSNQDLISNSSRESDVEDNVPDFIDDLSDFDESEAPNEIQQKLDSPIVHKTNDNIIDYEFDDLSDSELELIQA